MAKFQSEERITPPFLDIACGDNILTENQFSSFGVDIINYGKVDILVEDFSVLPFKNNTFNSISIVASLNYFDNPKSVLLETHRILRPSGKLILTLTNPFIGTIWHYFREPWAKTPSFSINDLYFFINDTDLSIYKRSRFMFGLNNLYFLIKNE